MKTTDRPIPNGISSLYRGKEINAALLAGSTSEIPPFSRESTLRSDKGCSQMTSKIVSASVQ